MKYNEKSLLYLTKETIDEKKKNIFILNSYLIFHKMYIYIYLQSFIDTRNDEEKEGKKIII